MIRPDVFQISLNVFKGVFVIAAITKVKDKNGKVIRYRCQVRRKGYPTLSENFRTLKAARTWGRQHEALIDVGKAPLNTDANNRTLHELIAQYTEDKDPVLKKVRQLKWWDNQIGWMLLSNITPAVINAQITILKKSPKQSGGKVSKEIEGTVKSLSTVNRYHAAISSVFKHAKNPLFWLETNPALIERQAEPDPIERYLDDEERESLLAACADSAWQGLLPMVWVALSTGARQSNVLQLRWSNIDLKAGRAYIPKTKNGSPITLPLVGEALEALKKWAKVRDLKNDWVFPAPTNPTKYYKDFRSHWLIAVEKAELKKHFRFHDLRHTTASYLASNNVNQATIMSIVGHKSLAASQRYMHLSVDHNADVLAKVFGNG